MATQNLAKRRRVRALEAKRDDLSIKLSQIRQQLAATRAELKQARKEA